MNRKKFFTTLLGLGALGVSSYYGIKLHGIYKEPDLKGLDQYKNLLNELGELIIPQTDTPGAKAADVGSFIVQYCHVHPDKKSVNRFIEGLEELNAYALAHYDKKFELLSANDKKKYSHGIL